MTSANRTERAENLLQVLILLGVGLMAGAASFTHVHDWTMDNSPEGTGDWFGWANAVISELTPTAAGLEIRRRKRHSHPVGYPMAVLVLAAALSIAAQLAVAKPSPTGWLLSAVPALAFLALTKLVLSTPTATSTHADDQRGQDDEPTITVQATTDQPPALLGPATDTTPPADQPVDLPADEAVTAELLTSAQTADFAHRQTNNGRAITVAELAEYLSIDQGLAATVHATLNGTPTNGGRP